MAMTNPDPHAAGPQLRVLRHTPHQLPAQATSFIGRERELDELQRLLTSARLVTLTGPGGCGKTRLALQVASIVQPTFADDVWLAELAALSEPGLVAGVVCAALGIHEHSNRPPAETLADYLRPRSLLLLLDNCEHLLAACAALAATLLAACPQVRLLATSRAPLRVRGEHEYPLPPLALPGRTQFADLAAVARAPAVALFVDRVRAVQPDFALTGRNAQQVAGICARLDGLPLAIELVAARSKVFPPQALLARLAERLPLLTAGARDLPARQQTLHAAIDWSYALLNEREQQIFRQLAVFVGGCTLEAAEMVIGDEQLELEAGHPQPPSPTPQPSILDALAALVDQSMLRRLDQPDDIPRFTMLETIGEYALRRLEQSGEAGTQRERHAAYYLHLAETAEPHLAGGDQQTWLAHLEPEHDNMRAALTWSLSDKVTRRQSDKVTESEESFTRSPAHPLTPSEIGLRLAGALWWFWHVSGRQREGRDWLERLLAGSTERTAVRAKALLAAGRLAFVQGEIAAAGAMITDSLAIYRELGNSSGIMAALDYLGDVERRLGNYQRAEALCEESLALARALGNKPAMTDPLRALGDIALDQGDYARAAARFTESLALARELRLPHLTAWVLHCLGEVARWRGDYSQAITLHEEALRLAAGDKVSSAATRECLGFVMLEQGDYARAAALFTESLAVLWEMRYKNLIAYCLEGLAGVAQAYGQFERAARLLGSVSHLRTTDGIQLPPMKRAAYDRRVAAVRAGLGAVAFEAVWAAGQSLPLEAIVGEALVVPGVAAPSPAPLQSPAQATGLTAREIEVLRLVATGLTDAQVAERLILSTHTVSKHLQAIYGKLRVKSRSAATRAAIEMGLV